MFDEITLKKDKDIENIRIKNSKKQEDVFKNITLLHEELIKLNEDSQKEIESVMHDYYISMENATNKYLKDIKILPIEPEDE